MFNNPCLVFTAQDVVILIYDHFFNTAGNTNIVSMA